MNGRSGEREDGWAGREGSGAILVLAALCVPGWVAWARKTVPANLTVASFGAKPILLCLALLESPPPLRRPL